MMLVLSNNMMISIIICEVITIICDILSIRDIIPTQKNVNLVELSLNEIWLNLTFDNK
jgi:hypothetical protein